jgi:hypothetical protein
MPGALEHACSTCRSREAHSGLNATESVIATGYLSRRLGAAFGLRLTTRREMRSPRWKRRQLTLAWWVDSFDAPLPAEVERAVTGVAWEREARDQDLL